METSGRFVYHLRMKEFKLHLLTQEDDFVSPFPRLTDGFNDRWWHGQAGRVGDDSSSGLERIQLLSDNTEVGRVEVTNWSLSDSYVGIGEPLECKEIWFFEIRATERRKGLGTVFAKLLCEHYRDVPLIAFSEQADEFWSGIGWIYYPRKDGDTTHYRKLFASQALTA